MLVHQVKAGRANDMTSQRGPCQSDDPELRDSSEYSGSPEWRLAGNLQIHHATLGTRLQDIRQHESRKTDMLQHIAVDNEVRFALRWIVGRGHPIHSWNAGNVVDERRCTVDQPAYQIATVASVIEDALYLPFTNVLAKNRSKDGRRRS